MDEEHVLTSCTRCIHAAWLFDRHLSVICPQVLKPQPSVVMEEDSTELEKQEKEVEGGAALTSANLAAASADASPQQAWAVIDFGADANLHALEEEEGHTAASNTSRSVDWPALPASGGKVGGPRGGKALGSRLVRLLGTGGRKRASGQGQHSERMCAALHTHGCCLDWPVYALLLR